MSVLLTLGMFVPSLSPLLASDFNPNYLISDEEMQNYHSMNRADIQAFLDDYPGALANLKTIDKNGVNRTASDIIYRAAKEHEINPKYLLVKLQKEQSLITDSTPTQKQLDGATGYGITDGCGWSCEMYFNNKGFGKQVDSAAGIIRWYYDEVGSQGWIKKPHVTYNIDGQSVKPANYATAFLYTYTPHLQGNENFYKLWQKWFEQVYPDGTLVKEQGGSTVYLIKDGKKRAINSMSVLVSRFDPKMIVETPASELNRYETGPALSFPNYSILKNGSKYYLLDFDTIRQFSSYDVVKKLGYNPGEIVEVTSSDIAGYEKGNQIKLSSLDPNGRLVKLEENNALYYLKDGEFHSISDPQIAEVNFPNLAPEEISISVLQDYQEGGMLKFQDGTLFGIKGSNKIYVVEKGKKRHIASEDVYNGLGYQWGNIVWTDQLTGLNHPTAQPIYLRVEMDKINIVEPEQTTVVGDDSIDTVIEETGEMYAISESETKYIGEKFNTPINTYLVADYETGEILIGKNVDVVRPLASFTKVMTSYRLMKEGLSLNKVSTYIPSEHKSSYHRYKIASGEQIQNKDLLDVLLISSLNTPARILVDSVEDNESKFIERMNDQAEDWGLTKTQFTDTYGYDLGNVTTAREYLTLFKNATKNKTVKTVLGSKSYEYDEIKDLNGSPGHLDEHSNHLVNKAGLGFNIISSKTGYLHEAGAGLAMLIERPSDKKQFIVITMGNPANDTKFQKRFDEPERLAEWVVSSL